MRRTIFKIERDQTKGGRIINVLLALLTARKYALIFNVRITLVRRNYTPESLKRRTLDNLFIFVVLFPIVMGVTFGMKQCKNTPTPTHIEKEDSIPQETEKPDPTPLATLAP